MVMEQFSSRKKKSKFQWYFVCLPNRISSWTDIMDRRHYNWPWFSYLFTSPLRGEANCPVSVYRLAETGFRCVMLYSTAYFPSKGTQWGIQNSYFPCYLYYRISYSDLFLGQGPSVVQCKLQVLQRISVFGGPQNSHRHAPMGSYNGESLPMSTSGFICIKSSKKVPFN